MSLWAPPWHQGLTVQQELVSVDAAFLALDVGYVTDRVLRAFTGDVETDLIENLIRAATEIGEDHMHQSIRPASRRLLTSGFPPYFDLPMGPIRSVDTVEYYDADNALQPYGGSPPTWTVTGSRLEPGVGESWPSTATRAGAVVVTYSAGYETPADIPFRIRHGIALLVGELYKNPDLSNDAGQQANLLTLDHFFPRHY